MKRLLPLIALVVLLVGGWYAASPWWTLKQMRDAADAGDVEALSAHVDWDALRRDIAEDVAIELVAAGGGTGLDATDRAARLRVARATREAAERMVTPRALAIAFASMQQAQALDIPLPALKSEGMPDIAYRGIDRIEVRAAGEEEGGSEAPAYVFRRSGLTWRLSGLD